MQSVDAVSLKEIIDNKEDFLLIDVREHWEHEAFNIGGLLIPMNEIFQHLQEIPADKPVVFYCCKGIRSALVIQKLQQKYPYTNLINLAGGMDAWQATFK